jgi:hypothetical protein
MAYANYPNGLAGYAGGASSFVDNVGSIATMTGNGGAAGGTHITADVTAKTGGTATGGTIMNNTGGGTPAVTVDQSITSGGAVGLWEAGRDGVGATGEKVQAESLLQGDDGQGLTNGPSTWGQESSWFISPLNIQMTIGRYINPGTTTEGQAREFIPAGSTGIGGTADASGWAQDGYAGDFLYSFHPAPLTGGVGGSGNYTYVSGGGATLGAGGGGMYSRKNASLVMSCAGGHGGVIIIPISLGS